MSDEQKPPKGWRWVEVGETIERGDFTYKPANSLGCEVSVGGANTYIRPLKSGDKPVTQKWLNKHKKIDWNIEDTHIRVEFHDGRMSLVLWDSGDGQGVPLKNRRQLKRVLKALDLPFEKVN